MTDSETTFQDLKDAVHRFREERGWARHHGPKNIAESLSVEANELLECFLWKEKQEVIDRLESDPEYRRRVEDEFADVVFNIGTFALDAGIDITAAFERKLEKTNEKYPAEK